jgi:hypothetical protein
MAVTANRGRDRGRLEGSPRRPLLRMAAAVSAGAITGFVVGGLGGRLAMFVLRLTSDPSVRGLSSDDGFTIGVFSAATSFLLVFATVLGAAAGALYLALRLVLPERGRVWYAAALGAVLGGALLVHTDGIDFTLLQPALLAIAMFVAISAGYGAGTSLLAERFLREGSVLDRPVAILAFAPLALVALRGALALLALLGVFAIAVAAPRL